MKIRVMAAIAVFSSALLCGCGRTPDCATGESHHWGKWQTQYTNISYGVKMIRYCKVCGLRDGCTRD